MSRRFLLKMFSSSQGWLEIDGPLDQVLKVQRDYIERGGTVSAIYDKAEYEIWRQDEAERNVLALHGRINQNSRLAGEEFLRRIGVANPGKSD